MTWLAPLAGFLGGIIAAGLAAFAAWRTNSSRMAADISARWDAALLDKSTEFVAAARSVRHLAERYGRAADKEFYRSVRIQLRAPDPEDVIHDDELDNIVQNKKPLAWDQRASKIN